MDWALIVAWVVFLAVLPVQGPALAGDYVVGPPAWHPFQLPGLEVPPGGPLDLSRLSLEPTGSGGFVRVAGGHLVDGQGRRLRLFGTNLTGDSALPPRETAPRLARRLAQLGFNALRLHRFDRNRGGIWSDRDPEQLSPEALARLDRLVEACSREGIYLVLGLHAARSYPGQPSSEGPEGFSRAHSLDRWYPPYLSLFKDYCRKLLDRVNPLTGRRYSQEPAIAWLELDNESSFIGDLRRELPHLPQPFRDELRRLWNEWLKERYQTTAALEKAWSGERTPLGRDLIRDRNWSVYNGNGALSRLAVGPEGLRWRAIKRGLSSWDLLLRNRHLKVEAGCYTLTFKARAEPDLSPVLSLMTDGEPWRPLGPEINLRLSRRWQEFGFCLELRDPGPGRRAVLNLTLNNRPGRVEIKDLALRRGGGEDPPLGLSLEDGVDLPGPRAAGARARDFLEFLARLELRSTAERVSFLKQELGCRMPVVDTQVSFGGLPGLVRESSLSDLVDMHGYWEHPFFTLADEGGWPPALFHFRNSSQVSQAGGGSLAGLALYRVAGKPFTVTEYNVPSPNDHGAELFPLLAAMAGLQDWDGIFAYTYSDYGHDFQNPDLSSWFRLVGRANVLVQAPLAALIHRQGLIRPAGKEKRLVLPPKEALGSAAARPGGLPWLWSDLGLEPAQAWRERLSVEISGSGAPRLEEAEQSPPGAADDLKVTFQPGDPAGAWLGLQAPSVRILVGYLGGRTLTLGGITFRFAQRPWPGGGPAFASLTMVSLDGRPLEESRRVALAASARTENRLMGWNRNRTSVAMDQWGQGPPLSEGVGLSLSLPGAPFRLVVLDERGFPLPRSGPSAGPVDFPAQAGSLWAVLVRE